MKKNNFKYSTNHNLIFKWLKPKENKLLLFFVVLLLVLIIRLFFLQILEAGYYKKLLFLQHFKMYSLSPTRGNIYLEDKS
jgi:cell division protein FtsI/penicillin-binding protein 2